MSSTSNTSTGLTTRTGQLAVHGARLYHEIRGAGPVLVLVGSPMGAADFAPLADRMAVDHLVVTLDPRGTGRSPVDDPDQDSTPERRAADLAELLRHVDGGPAAAFGSSGGAVTALALAQNHPDLVHTVIAHEPPLTELLPDREQRRAVTEEIIAAYLTEGRAAAWRLFLADANIDLPEPVFDEMFGGRPDPQQAADEHFFFVHELRPTTHWLPDLAMLRDAPVRIVLGIGTDSAGQVCDRTTTALAEELGLAPTSFPGDHTGFVEDPETFADHLRTVLVADQFEDQDRHGSAEGRVSE